MKEIATFAYILKPVRPDFIESLTPEEEKVIDVHFEYLKQGFLEGTVILAGRCLDGEFGIVIFRARSQMEADEFVNNDPAVMSGLMTARLYPFHVALLEKT